MTTDEAFTRIVRGHPWVIAVCLTLPILAVLVTQLGRPPTYTSSSRLQVADVLAASNVEADAAVSRATAIATSPSVVSTALRAAGIAEDPTRYAAQNITVAGIGASPIVELSATASDPQRAQTVASSLSAQVVSELNNDQQASTQAALDLVDSQISTTQTSRNAVATKILALPPGTAAPGLQAQLASLDAELSSLRTQRSAIAVAATRPPVAAVVDPAVTPNAPQPSGLLPLLGLALLFGLLLALAAASILETLRPRLSSAEAAAQRLGLRYLGDVGAKARPTVVPVLRRLTELANESGVGSVLLLPVAPVESSEANELARLLAAEPISGADQPGQEASSRVLVMPLGSGRSAEPEGHTLGAVRWTALDVAAPPHAIELTAGFVLLVAAHTRLSNLRQVQRQLEAAGRPVLALVGVSGRLSPEPEPDHAEPPTAQAPQPSQTTQSPATQPAPVTPPPGTPPPATSSPANGAAAVGKTNGAKTNGVKSTDAKNADPTNTEAKSTDAKSTGPKSTGPKSTDPKSTGPKTERPDQTRRWPLPLTASNPRGRDSG